MAKLWKTTLGNIFVGLSRHGFLGATFFHKLQPAWICNEHRSLKTFHSTEESGIDHKTESMHCLVCVMPNKVDVSLATTKNQQEEEEEGVLIFHVCSFIVSWWDAADAAVTESSQQAFHYFLPPKTMNQRRTRGKSITREEAEEGRKKTVQSLPHGGQ